MGASVISEPLSVRRTWIGLELRAKLWMVLLAGLNLADVVTTRVGLDRGAVEQNPLMAGLVGSLPGAVAAKVVLLGLATLMLLMAARRGRSVIGVLVLANVWYLAIFVWNVRVITLQT